MCSNLWLCSSHELSKKLQQGCGAKIVNTFELDSNYCTTFHKWEYVLSNSPESTYCWHLTNSKFSWSFRQMAVCKFSGCANVKFAYQQSPRYRRPLISRSVICQLIIYQNFVASLDGFRIRRMSRRILNLCLEYLKSHHDLLILLNTLHWIFLFLFCTSKNS